MKGKYDDIINLPHHVSKTRPQMSRMSRAAQFSPFAALVGFDQSIAETARQTQIRQSQSEEARAVIDQKLRFLADHPDAREEVTVTYFVPDSRKEGGAYQTVRGSVKKVDPFDYLLILLDGTKIPFEDICSIESPFFRNENG